MGYLKYKADDNEFNSLISTEDVVSVRLESSRVKIEYGAGFVLTLIGDSALAQEDVNTIINGINILNGSSGSSLDINFTDILYEETVSKITAPAP